MKKKREAAIERPCGEEKIQYGPSTTKNKGIDRRG
jgi:hypothetical protein